MTTSRRTPNSLDTILTYENRELSQWSVQWSTTHIPGMDNATGRPRSREVGRRRIRLGALVLGGLLTMHCRVAASALTGGLFFFFFCLIMAVGVLASPMRHFEVYLGQWSISGPGRSFRIIPMLDGIGIAICINAIVRAINFCFIAAIASMYVIHSVSDTELPFTYCSVSENNVEDRVKWRGKVRKADLTVMFEDLYLIIQNPQLTDFRDFNLAPYKPIIKDLQYIMLRQPRLSADEPGKPSDIEKYKNYTNNNMFSTTVGLSHNAWRNATLGYSTGKHFGRLGFVEKLSPEQIATCNEKYSGKYPTLYTTPPYNFFYVEVVRLRDNKNNIGKFNTPVLISNVLIWCILWALMISERFRYGQLIWNNVFMWLIVIPLLWALILLTAAISSLLDLKISFRKLFRVGAKEMVATIADALEVALYIHSVGVGTEIIHGKGLNHYASGHIDPHLNAENIWHSVLLLFVTSVHGAAAALCAEVDSNYLKSSDANLGESTLWIMPMYSKCTSLGNYSHFLTTIIFGGLMFSYTAVAFVLLKTALHTIFEYRVKLVFIEQVIVGALIVTCIGLSLAFASNGGITLLESVDALMSGIATATICLLELIGLLYVYRAHDFVSDMNLSQEETACPTRVDWQWRMIPFITMITILLKGLKMAQTEMPKMYMCIALAPLVGVALAVPLRALHNAVVFMRPNPRHGT